MPNLAPHQWRMTKTAIEQMIGLLTTLQSENLADSEQQYKELDEYLKEFYPQWETIPNDPITLSNIIVLICQWGEANLQLRTPDESVARIPHEGLHDPQTCTCMLCEAIRS